MRSRQGGHRRREARGRVAFATMLTLIVMCVSTASVHAGFQPQTEFSVALKPTALAVADFNSDGKPDLVFTSELSYYVHVLLGNGNGTFQDERTAGTGVNPIAVAVGHFNADTKPDLVVANSADDTVSVLLGNGDGTFQTQQTFATGALPRAVAVADVNADNKRDLIVANAFDGTVSVLLGNGNGTFQARQTFASQSSNSAPWSVAVGDFDDDNKPDIVVANYGDDSVSILAGNGNGTFQAPLSFAAGAGPRSLVVADLDADGDLDVVVANEPDNTVSVLQGRGDGVFFPPDAQDTGLRPYSVTVADLNADAVPDLVAANYNGNSVSVLLGIGNGTFLNQKAFYAGLRPYSVATADVNADTRPDLVVTNYDGNAVSLLLGTANGALQFSTAAVNAVEGGTATLTLSRTGSTTGSVRVTVSRTGGTATQGSDFTFAAPQTVSWADGDAAPKTVSVPILSDLVSDPGETAQFTVALQPAASWGVLGSQTTTTVTIGEVPTPAELPTLGFSSANVTVAEGNGGTTNATFTVTLSAASASSVTVNYATTNGTATAGSDYTTTSGSLTFAPGQTSKPISVPVSGDTTAEPDEAFTVALSSPTNATLGTAQATGTITNDDSAPAACSPRPRVALTSTQQPDGRLQVTVTAGNGALQSIQFATATRSIQNGTVQFDAQQITTGMTVPLAANTTTKTFMVTRTNPAAPMTVPLIVTDGCGAWETFVGIGAGT